VSATEPASSSARPLLLRQLNARTVLETIRERGPVSRAEIARIAGISKPTVSLALRALLEAELVREAAAGKGPTYGATFFQVDPEAAAVIGIDIGARYLRAAVADVTGAIRAREDVEIGDAPAAASRVLVTIPKLAQRLVAEAGLHAERVACAVVGVPGVVEPGSGRVGLAENVPALEGKPVAKRLRDALGVEVKVFNDVNLAAIGERDHGAGRGVESFVFVSVGTGLGAGLVVRGELVAGSHGAAGELDLMRPAVASDSDPSAPAIRVYASELQADVPRRRRVLDTAEIFERARAGESWALGIASEVARRICAHIVPIAAIVDPELVVLGGGIGSNGDLLLAPLREMLSEALPYPPAVQTSELGRDAVLSGALALGVADARDWSFSVPG
jgi:predicted NBD/HSP70 family sugar kinase